MNSKSLLFMPIVVLSLASCTNEEILDKAFTLGAQTTANVLIDECSNRYKNLPITKKEAKTLAETGLNKSRDYFISINEEKWIGEAIEVASSSLEVVSINMTEEKCTHMVNAIVKDGGVKKSISVYYK